ncbi:MAG: T9SS type A sorting domain-containing protein [Winogradskyella sp.]|uniref:T9SS type A sorting domain-containing protein n=1 Tax=Winogradskyella sp. TaxID=1883156 RepID=UPI0017D64442|nr:T9SS type A sorting domain-containing protein [Winogradskyella sp.]MBT8244830.1 T9SS type A sorting domain-containing protein [Winogradskyella sp.]NNK23832.1 T9SS type A sorting domain-containing protein [Winogradskyella sp.]
MKKLYFLLFTFLISAVSFGQVINEVDADTPGTDAAEFVEIFWTPNTSLDGLVVVFFNGSDDASYLSYDLDGFSTDANGFFILGNTAIISAGDLEIPPGGSSAIQNGADAVALISGNASDFPNDTPITPFPMGTTLISGVVYDTNDGDDTALLSAIGGIQYNEDENMSKDTQSVQRNIDGTYTVKNITFRASNDAAVCELTIGAVNAVCDNITSGTDTYTATISFTGGGTSTYTVTADSGTVDLSMGNPSMDASGTITVNSVNEGTDVIVTIQDGGLCDIDTTVNAVDCIPVLTLPISEDFTYADGPLVSNPNWSNFSGINEDLQIVSGQALVKHGSPSEDASIAFTPVAGDIYFGIDFTVQDPGSVISGGNYEYFAFFKDNSFGFSGRLSIVEANTPGNDFTVGIATDSSTEDAIWATDFSFGTTYRAVLRYNQSTNISELWIDAASDTDTSILGADLDDANARTISELGLRQSDSSQNEGVLVDNLLIGQTFIQVLSANNNFQIREFSIYPNPTNTGEITISSVNTAPITVTVFDMLGKQVKNETISNNKLNVSNLKSGIYLTKITQDGATSTKKLVIR